MNYCWQRRDGSSGAACTNPDINNQLAEDLKLKTSNETLPLGKSGWMEGSELLHL